LITRVEATNFRCLKSVSQPLRSFQVLVGPNSSGKSAFIDVIDFLSDMVSSGLSHAVGWRTENFHDLIWGRCGSSLTLAIEAQMPAAENAAKDARTIRYEIRIALDAATDQLVIEWERLTVRNDSGQQQPVLVRQARRANFWDEADPGIYEGGGSYDLEGGGDYDLEGGGTYNFELSSNYPGLANLPDDRTKFPAAVWLKELLQGGVQLVDLDNDYLGGASPPGQGQPRVYDGQSLARTVLQVSDSSAENYHAWLKHIQTALPDVESIRTVLRPEDRHRYLMVRYKNGIEVPSWMLSGGTLRLLALTLLAYIPTFRGVYLIEEPEIGVHPTAIETIVQSLSSVYSGQVILTSHSPILLSLPEPRDLLCFQRTDEGTVIIPGDQHPLLQDWRSGVSIGDLFAAGVLG